MAPWFAIGVFLTPQLVPILEPGQRSAGALETSALEGAGFSVTNDWRFTGYGKHVGAYGMVSSRALGHLEIYAMADLGSPAATYWYALRPEGSTKRLRQVYTSPLPWPPGYQYFLPNGIALGNLHPNPGLEIVTCYTGKGVQVYDQATKHLLATVPVIDFQGNLVLADLDADGWDEIITAGYYLRVYSHTGVLLFDGTGMSHGYALWQAVVGNMDGDPGMEIATNLGEVLDWLQLTVQCTLPETKLNFMALSDIDHDGQQEILGTTLGVKDLCHAFDVDTCSTKWIFELPFWTTAMTVGDVQGDGDEELLVGDSYGAVRGFDLTTLGLLFTLRAKPNYVGCIFVEDIDSDGTREVLWGENAPSNYPGYLFVGDWRSQELIWVSPQLDEAVIGPAVGDVDGDGREEIVSATADFTSSSNDSRILVFDAATRVLEATSGPVGTPSFLPSSIRDLQLRDIDSDPQQEVLVTTLNGSKGTVRAFDVEPGGFITRKPVEYLLQPFGGQLQLMATSADVADVDGDGNLEVAVGAFCSVSTGGVSDIRLFDARSGALEWVLPGLTKLPRVLMADLDADGVVEILVDEEWHGVFCLDGITKQIEAVMPIQVASVAVETLAGDDRPTILIGEQTGRVRGFQHTGQAFLEVLDFHPTLEAIKGVGFGRDRSILVTTGKNILWCHPFSAPTVIWQADEVAKAGRSRFVWMDDGHTLLTTCLLGLLGYHIE
jgi:hypothetical protein